MQLIPPGALLYFEKMIYLPMVVVVLEKDRELFEEGPFKLKRPYVKIVEGALKHAQIEYKKTSLYLKQHKMELIRGKTDHAFTEYVFVHNGRKDHRRYSNIRLRNRTEELVSAYFAMVKS